MRLFCSDAPEVSVSPSKIFINSPPAQVRFSCLVNSYPESEIMWVYSSHLKEPSTSHHRGPKSQRQIILSKVSNKHYRNHRKFRRSLTDEEIEKHGFILDNNLALNSKYQISLQTINETFKESSIVINVENENDFGVYLCYANNSIGSKFFKFFIYGGQLNFIFVPKLREI